MKSRFPSVGPRPAITYNPEIARAMVGALARPGDTIASVTADNGDVFRRPPACAERHAPLLRAMAAELTLAGIDERCGVRVEAIVDDGTGFHVQPRFQDGLLAWIVDAYETLSQEPADAQPR